jgi:hypothetical protein
VKVVRTISKSNFVFLLVFGFITISAILFANDQSAGSGLISAKVYETDIDGKLHFKKIIQQPIMNHRTQPEQMPGWPKSMGITPMFAPVGANVADIDEDGFLEILVGSTDGSFYVWDYQGIDLTGWPKTGLNHIQSKCAVGDIDPAYPGLEIVAAGKTNTLYVWHNDGTDVPGWPQNVGETGALKSPVIYDLNNDGSLEIILGQRLYPEGRVLIFNSDGTAFPGWPQSLDYMCVATPSVGDVDNDGIPEICAVSYYSVYLWDRDGTIKPGWPILNVAGGMSYAQPILADLDGDFDLEILHSYYSSNTDYVGIYHHDGTNYTNWPQNFPGPQTYVMPVPGDIDNDNSFEIFGGGHSNDMNAKHLTGETVSGWPVTVSGLECSSIIFDLNDDGDREIVVGDNSSSLHAFNGDGSIVEDWPISAGGCSGVNSAVVADVDGDGDIEIALVVGNGTVNLWTIENVQYRSYLTEWGTYFHDIWNTGFLHPMPPLNLIAESFPDHIYLTWNANSEPDLAGYNVYQSDLSGGPYTKLNDTPVVDTIYCDNEGSSEDFYCVTAVIKANAESRLSNEAFAQVSVDDALESINQTLYNYPNPFNPSGAGRSPETTIYFTTEHFGLRSTTSGQAKDVEIIIYNIKGQKIKTLPVILSFTRLGGGVEGKRQNNRFSVTWNGTDDNNKPVVSGIYLYQLINNGTASKVKKMLLLK